MAKAVSQQPKKATAPIGKYPLDIFRARLILVFACIVCYGNTVFNDYALDDDFAVTSNAYVQKGIAGIPDLLTHSYLTTGTKSFDYRPVAGITFAIEKQFFGNNPHISHLLNILFYILLILLVYQILTEVFLLNTFHPLLPLMITLFYAVHPSHTEVVASIKNREEILSTAFALLALLYFYRFCKQAEFQLSTGAAAFLFIVLSLITKLTSLPMLVVIGLTGFFYGFHKKNKRFILLSALMAVCAAGYFLFLYSKLQRTFYFYENPLSLNTDLSVKLGTMLETVWFYFRFMFYPYPFSFYYGYNTIPLTTLSGFIPFISLVIHLSLLISGIYLFVKRKVTGLLILSYLAYLSIYSNLIMIYTGIVSERALFAPGLWFIAALAVPVTTLANSLRPKNAWGTIKPVMATFFALVFGAFIWLTIQRNFQWKDSVTLMSSDIGHLQNSTLANFFYGSILQQAGENASDTSRQSYLEKAKHYYRQTIAVSPGYPEPLFKLGMIYEYDENRNDSAFYYFKTAYPMDTALLPERFQLAKLYMLKGNYKEAIPMFQKLYQQSPTDTFTLFFFAQGLFFTGDTAGAMRVNNQLLALAPNIYQPYLNRGMFNKILGHMPAAEPDLIHALQMGCTDPIVFNTLLNYYLESGQTEKANALQKYVGKNP